jgi:hypothetical protein
VRNFGGCKFLPQKLLHAFSYRLFPRLNRLHGHFLRLPVAFLIRLRAVAPVNVQVSAFDQLLNFCEEFLVRSGFDAQLSNIGGKVGRTESLYVLAANIFATFTSIDRVRYLFLENSGPLRERAVRLLSGTHPNASDRQQYSFKTGRFE